MPEQLVFAMEVTLNGLMAGVLYALVALGFVLIYKRLERGRFKLPPPRDDANTLELEGAQLVMLLEGIDFARVRSPTPWKPASIRRPIDLEPRV